MTRPIDSPSGDQYEWNNTGWDLHSRDPYDDEEQEEVDEDLDDEDEDVDDEDEFDDDDDELDDEVEEEDEDEI